MGRAKLWRLTYITAAARHTWTGGCSENRRPSGWTAKPLGKKNLWNISTVSIDSNEIKCTSRLILKSFSYRVSEEISAICSAFSTKVCNQKSEISIWTQSFLIKFSKVLSVFYQSLQSKVRDLNMNSIISHQILRSARCFLPRSAIKSQRSQYELNHFSLNSQKCSVFSTKVCNQKSEISTWTQSFLTKFSKVLSVFYQSLQSKVRDLNMNSIISHQILKSARCFLPKSAIKSQRSQHELNHFSPNSQKCSVFSTKVCNQKSEISTWTQSFLTKFSKVLVFSTKVCNQKPEISTWTQSFLNKFSKVLGVFYQSLQSKVRDLNMNSIISQQILKSALCFLPKSAIKSQRSQHELNHFSTNSQKCSVFSTKVCNQKSEISIWTQSFLIQFSKVLCVFYQSLQSKVRDLNMNSIISH